MPDLIARHAVVIGAGMGGLAAAKAVAPYFDKVIVLDRDALPDGPAPRAGTPQARHAHGLLAGGQKALEELFPGIESELAKAGAVSLNVGDIMSSGPVLIRFLAATSASTRSAFRVRCLKAFAGAVSVRSATSSFGPAAA